MRLRFFVLLLACILVFLAGFGCSRSEITMGDFFGRVHVTVQDNAYGGKTISKTGKNPSLAKGFPREMPLPEGAEMEFYRLITDTHGAVIECSVTLVSTVEFQDLLDTYKGMFSEYKSYDELTVSASAIRADTIYLYGEKDEYAYTAALQSDGEKHHITLTMQKL